VPLAEHRHWDCQALRAAPGALAVPGAEADLPALGAREILGLYRLASISQPRADVGRLYAIDVGHEFPFHSTRLPSRLEGREAIMDWSSAGWEARLLSHERYRSLSVNDTSDPGTIVDEQEVIGTSRATGDFALPSIVVLTVAHGQITRFRDWVNIPAAVAALGRVKLSRQAAMC